MTIAITCASCGKTGLIDERSVDRANGKIDVLAFSAPAGFRKAMFGMTRSDVDLYCIVCKVPAYLPKMQ